METKKGKNEKSGRNGSLSAYTFSAANGRVLSFLLYTVCCLTPECAAYCQPVLPVRI